MQGVGKTASKDPLALKLEEKGETVYNMIDRV
jgi:hypothetical protein